MYFPSARQTPSLAGHFRRGVFCSHRKGKHVIWIFYGPGGQENAEIYGISSVAVTELSKLVNSVFYGETTDSLGNSYAEEIIDIFGRLLTAGSKQMSRDYFVFVLYI